MVERQGMAVNYLIHNTIGNIFSPFPSSFSREKSVPSTYSKLNPGRYVGLFIYHSHVISNLLASIKSIYYKVLYCTW